VLRAGGTIDTQRRRRQHRSETFGPDNGTQRWAMDATQRAGWKDHHMTARPIILAAPAAGALFTFAMPASAGIGTNGMSINGSAAATLVLPQPQGPTLPSGETAARCPAARLRPLRNPRNR
jgi:hypothetical protein